MSKNRPCPTCNELSRKSPLTRRAELTLTLSSNIRSSRSRIIDQLKGLATQHTITVPLGRISNHGRRHPKYPDPQPARQGQRYLGSGTAPVRRLHVVSHRGHVHPTPPHLLALPPSHPLHSPFIISSFHTGLLIVRPVLTCRRYGFPRHSCL